MQRKGGPTALADLTVRKQHQVIQNLQEGVLGRIYIQRYIVLTFGGLRSPFSDDVRTVVQILLPILKEVLSRYKTNLLLL